MMVSLAGAIRSLTMNRGHLSLFSLIKISKLKSLTFEYFLLEYRFQQNENTFQDFTVFGFALWKKEFFVNYFNRNCSANSNAWHSRSHLVSAELKYRSSFILNFPYQGNNPFIKRTLRIITKFFNTKRICKSLSALPSLLILYSMEWVFAGSIPDHLPTLIHIETKLRLGSGIKVPCLSFMKVERSFSNYSS